jgi:hypothetical protein
MDARLRGHDVGSCCVVVISRAPRIPGDRCTERRRRGQRHAPRPAPYRFGKRAITADTDLRLARYFGLSEGFLQLQTDYELMARRRQIGEQLKAIRPRAA